MNFFLKRDWFNREGPFSFTLEHFLFIALTIIVGLALSFLLRKKKESTIRITLISMWIFVIAIDLVKWIIVWTCVAKGMENLPFDTTILLPLHSCSMFMYVFPLAFFCKVPIIKKAANNFLVTINMIMGFITLFVGFGGKGCSVFSFFGLHTLLFHTLIFIVPLIMLITGIYKVEKLDFLYGLGLFLILAILVFIFDHITGMDYMYIYDGHTFGVFKFIYENVHHLVWTLISVSAYLITGVATHFIVYGITKLVKKS
ncbi:MAG: YwaF family protein [Bacilli bacterium]|nr:YwaF family protein [Bacilli bacterium]MBR1581985.1 YwaF family protein [Bacilli bacterium]